LIGVPNFFAAKFLLGALTKLPAVVVYPSFSVGTMLLVTLTGVAVFRERLSRGQWVALAAIIVALVLLNI
jgi:multidrug transporter EmrE-like cation transporter